MPLIEPDFMTSRLMARLQRFTPSIGGGASRQYNIRDHIVYMVGDVVQTGPYTLMVGGRHGYNMGMTFRYSTMIQLSDHAYPIQYYGGQSAKFVAGPGQPITIQQIAPQTSPGPPPGPIYSPY